MDTVAECVPTTYFGGTNGAFVRLDDGGFLFANDSKSFEMRCGKSCGDLPCVLMLANKI
jgi:hypothetical protein